MSVWIPPSVHRRLFEEFLPMALFRPHLFSDAAGVPLKSIWFIAGRLGNQKGEALKELLINEQAKLHPKRDHFNLCYFNIGIDDYTHAKEMEDILAINKEQKDRVKGTPHSRTGTVILIDHGDRLANSGDGNVVKMFNELPSLIRGNHLILLICCDTQVTKLPLATRTAYQYERQILFPSPPDDDGGAWRAAFFKTLFQNYQTFISQNEMGSIITVDVTDDDIAFLVECSAFTTVDEMKDFCCSVIQSVHVLSQEKRVINLDLLKKFLKDDGSALVLSLEDGYKIEQQFLASGGIKGIPPLPERTERTITKQQEVVVEDTTFRYTFDKDGKEVPINEFGKRPRENE